MGVKTIKFIDRYIGIPLCILFGLFCRLSPKKGYGTKKILFIQLWGIGETILALPAIRALRKRFPKADISVLCTKRNDNVYFGDKDIDSVIRVGLDPFSILVFSLKNYKKYDMVIDFEEYLNISSLMALFTGKYRIGFSHGVRSMLYNKRVNYNDRQHVVQTHLDLVRPVGADFKLDRLIRLGYSKADYGKAKILLKKLGIKKADTLIGLGAGAAESAKSRMWPKERFALLVDKLSKRYRNAMFLFFGAEQERELNDDIIRLAKGKNVHNLAGKLSLRETFALIGECSLFISNDTGTMHMAAAQGVKTIGLFGPNLPVRWGPYGRGNLSVYKGGICRYSPCINVHKGQVPECRFGNDNKCMKAIKVEDVLKLGV